MFDFTKKMQVMGILNVTPDSFSDGGKYDTTAKILTHAKEMIAAGADIIDIGGQSTRPGYTEVSPQTELDRVLPAIKGIRSFSEIPISIDTYFLEVAETAINAGANIVNDIKGLDTPGMIEVIAAHPQVSIIIMHSRKRKDLSLEADICGFFEEKLALCDTYHISDERICLDPGIGFNKNIEENLLIMSHPENFRVNGLPLLYGSSRKRVIGSLTDEVQADQRDVGSVTAALYATACGVEVQRVHNVKGTVQALKVWQTLTRQETVD